MKSVTSAPPNTVNFRLPRNIVKSIMSSQRESHMSMAMSKFAWTDLEIRCPRSLSFLLLPHQYWHFGVAYDMC